MNCAILIEVQIFRSSEVEQFRSPVYQRPPAGGSRSRWRQLHEKDFFGKGVCMSRYAVIFPGIGYHVDKPLLYFGKMLARKNGYEIIEVPYGNFKKGIKGNAEKMKEAFESALEQSEKLLADVRWEDAEEILFISKSIGTIVAGAFAQQKSLRVRHVWFTPLKETFLFDGSADAIAFHGTADPWASDEDIEEGCRQNGIPLTEIPGANHSLEKGDALTDLANLPKVMEAVSSWL